MPKNWCFWTVCWIRLLRVLWTERRSNQSILREINPEYSLEGLILKLKRQYFGHLMRTDNSLENLWCWERLRAEGEEGIRWWDGWMASLMQWTWTGQTLGEGEGQGGLACCSHWGWKESDMTGQLNSNNKGYIIALMESWFFVPLWCMWWLILNHAK